MNEELHRYLDGDIGPRDLDPEIRGEAEVWERLTASLRRDVPGPAPSWIETGVMAAVRDRTPQRESVFAWLKRPRTVRLSPLTMGGLAAAALVITVLLRAPTPAPEVPPGAAVVYVQFTLEAPDARTVSVSGDFNQWAADTRMDDVDGDGVWTVRVPVEPGRHEYMFVVDGERWITDPLADRYTDDGFGNRNAILAVPAPERSS